MAGSGGVVVDCSSGNASTSHLVYYDLLSQEYQTLFGPYENSEAYYEHNKEILLKLLQIFGVNDDLINSLGGLDNIGFTDKASNRDLEYGIVRSSSFTVSKDGKEFSVLWGQGWKEDDKQIIQYYLLGASESDPKLQLLYTIGDVSFEYSKRRHQHVPSTDEFFILDSVNGDIYVISHPGNKLENISEDFEPRIKTFGVSPDGTRIAFKTDEGVWVGNLEDNNFELVIELDYEYSSLHPYDGPRWSFDSKRIVFMNGDNLYIAEGDGSNLVEITNKIPGSTISSPQWTQDGRILLWSEERDYWSVIAVDLDNDGITKYITFYHKELSTYFREHPALWSPDNQWFISEINRSGQGNRIYLQSYICNLSQGNCVGLDVTDPEDNTFCGSMFLGGWVKNQP